MTLDTAGFVNYFLTSNFRSFQYRGRYDTGGSPLAQINGIDNANFITAIHDYGSFGFFV